MIRSPILVIEDSDEDFDVLRLLLAAMGVYNPLIRCATAAEAVEQFRRRGTGSGGTRPAERLPALILLDLNLPGMDGRELLTLIQADARLRSVPVIVLTTSANPRDVRYCYAAGASAYLVKPVDLDRLERMLAALVEFWLRGAVLAADVEDSA